MMCEATYELAAVSFAILFGAAAILFAMGYAISKMHESKTNAKKP